MVDQPSSTLSLPSGGFQPKLLNRRTEEGLAVRQHVSASTQNQALSALLFLYRQVLSVEIALVPPVVRAHA